MVNGDDDAGSNGGDDNKMQTKRYELFLSLIVYILETTVVCLHFENRVTNYIGYVQSFRKKSEKHGLAPF